MGRINMLREAEQTIGQLTNNRHILEAKLSNARRVFDTITSPNFETLGLNRVSPRLRLDVTDPSQLIENTVRVGSIREKLATVTIPRFTKDIGKVSDQIDALKTQSRHNRALSYGSRLVQLSEAGFLTPDLVEKSTAAIKQLGGTIEPTRSSTPEPPEQRGVRLGEKEQTILSAIPSSRGGALSVWAIADKTKIYGQETSPDVAAKRVASIIDLLIRKKGFGDIKKIPEDPEKGRWSRLLYYREITAVERGGPGDTQPTPKEFPHVHPTRLDALNLMLDDPRARADTIRKKLGQTKAGRPHTKPQAARALQHAIFLLYRRQKEGKMESDSPEARTFVKITSYIEANGMKLLKDFSEWARIRVGYKKLQVRIEKG